MTKKIRLNPYKLFNGANIPNWLLERREVASTAKLAYARLCQYAGKDGYAFPRQDTLAAKIGVSQRYTRKVLSELSKFGLIRIIRRGLGKSNAYEFLEHPWMSGFRKIKRGADPDRHPEASPSVPGVTQLTRFRS